MALNCLSRSFCAKLRNCAFGTCYLKSSATAGWLSTRSYDVSGLFPRRQPSLGLRHVKVPPLLPSPTDSHQIQKRPTSFQAYFLQLRKRCCSAKDPPPERGFQLIHTAPLKGAVRAIKIFSLCTAAAALCGSPVLVWFGNQSVPAAARVAISSIVMLAGLSTTAILHWLLKGYIMRLHYDNSSQVVAVDTLSVLARKKTTEFHISEAKPPPSTIGFHTFQANGKSFFLHTDVFEDKKLLSALLSGSGKFPNKHTETGTQY